MDIKKEELSQLQSINILLIMCERNLERRQIGQQFAIEMIARPEPASRIAIMCENFFFDVDNSRCIVHTHMVEMQRMAFYFHHRPKIMSDSVVIKVTNDPVGLEMTVHCIKTLKSSKITGATPSRRNRGWNTTLPCGLTQQEVGSSASLQGGAHSKKHPSARRGVWLFVLLGRRAVPWGFGHGVSVGAGGMTHSKSNPLRSVTP